MFLLAVSPVDHTEPSHAQGSAVRVNGDGAWNRIRASPVGIKVDKRPDIPFLAKSVSGVVVMGGVQADVPDRDIRVNGFKFPEGDDGADTVVASGIQETDMQGQVNTKFCIAGAEHVKGVSKIKAFLVTVPSPAGIGIGEMAFTGAASDTFFQAVTDLMPIRGGMGMDAGAVAGKGEAVFRDEPILKGWEDGSKAENLLEPFLIMEGKFSVFQGIGSHLIRDAGMLVGKLFPFAGLFGRFSVFVLREKVLPAGHLRVFRLRPEPVHQVKVRAQRREGVRGTAGQGGQEAVSLKLEEPDGQAGEAEHHHKDQGADDLCLVFGRPAGRGIEIRKVFHYRIQIQQAELLPDRAKFEQEPCALGRIKMYFSLMQEIQIFLMGLPVN